MALSLPTYHSRDGASICPTLCSHYCIWSLSGILFISLCVPVSVPGPYLVVEEDPCLTEWKTRIFLLHYNQSRHPRLRVEAKSLRSRF